MSSSGEVAAARSASGMAVVAALTPLVADYEAALVDVSAGQRALSERLEGLLRDMRGAQAATDEIDVGGGSSASAAAAAVPVYVKKVEGLRRRLDAVAYIMSRVQVRLESLQAAVTATERSANDKRKAEAAQTAAAAAAAAASAASMALAVAAATNAVATASDAAPASDAAAVAAAAPAT